MAKEQPTLIVIYWYRYCFNIKYVSDYFHLESFIFTCQCCRIYWHNENMRITIGKISIFPYSRLWQKALGGCDRQQRMFTILWFLIHFYFFYFFGIRVSSVPVSYISFGFLLFWTFCYYKISCICCYSLRWRLGAIQ